MDVSVIMQPQFPQSFVDNMEVPQTQFFNRVEVSWWLVASQRQVHSANCAEDRRDRTGAVLGPVGIPVVVQQQVLRFTEQKTVEVPQLQCSDKVQGVPVVQVVVQVEGASDSVHRQSWIMMAV